jgi:hypothetical protein
MREDDKYFHLYCAVDESLRGGFTGATWEGGEKREALSDNPIILLDGFGMHSG